MKRARIAFQGAMEFLFEQNFRFPELFLGKVCSCDALRSALLCHLRLSVSNVSGCSGTAVQSIRSVERPERFSASLTIDM
jgi:hypothetical protein